MIEIYNIFKEIEAESSKTKKMEILKKNSDNNTFKIFLSFMYDDTVTTGLSKKSIDNNICANEKYTEIELNSPLNVMEFIKENNTGSNQVIFTVQSYLNKLEDDDYSEWLKYVFAKEYKCGITANTINKIFPSLIHEFKVQLAHPYEKYVDKIKGKFYITQKLDGHRTICVIDKPSDSVKFLTRKGHRIYGLNEIENDIRRTFMKTLKQDAVVVLDGEITVSKKCLPKDIFSETSKIIRKDGDKVGLQFNIFDMLLHEDFLAGKSKQEYSVRREGLDSLMFIYLLNTEPLVKYLVHVPVLYQGTDKDEIAKWSDWATQQGHEGIMLNTADGFYETKRNSGLLKVKKFHNADVLCTGVFEGTGKYSGTLGGITIDYKGTSVGVGSGFTDEERDYYWNNQDEIIGKIIDVQFFEETTNDKNDGISLRFPTIKSVRTDKTVEDINID
jgi:DNA ligase 1